MAEKESSTTAKTALGLSIGGLGLELLQGAGGLPGLLGGLLGGRPGFPAGPNLERENIELRDKIVGMESNMFTTNALKDVYDKLNSQSVQLATIEQRDKDQRIIDGLQQQLTNSNIARVAEAAGSRMDCMDKAIACLRGDINSFSGRYVSAGMITPPVAPAPNPGPVPLAPVFNPMQVAVLQGMADSALRGDTTGGTVTTNTGA